MKMKETITAIMQAKMITMNFGTTMIIIIHGGIVGKEKMTQQVTPILIKTDGHLEIFWQVILGLR